MDLLPHLCALCVHPIRTSCVCPSVLKQARVSPMELHVGCSRYFLLNWVSEHVLGLRRVLLGLLLWRQYIKQPHRSVNSLNEHIKSPREFLIPAGDVDLGLALLSQHLFNMSSRLKGILWRWVEQHLLWGATILMDREQHSAGQESLAPQKLVLEKPVHDVAWTRLVPIPCFLQGFKSAKRKIFTGVGGRRWTMFPCSDAEPLSDMSFPWCAFWHLLITRRARTHLLPPAAQLPGWSKYCFVAIGAC